VRRLEDGDTASSVLAEFLGVLEGLDPAVSTLTESFTTNCPLDDRFER
jgi:hypothetical protein